MCAALPGAHAHKWGTEEAIARLERLKGDVADQEKLTDAIRRVVKGGDKGGKAQTCGAHDTECHRQERRERRRKANKGLAVASDPEDPVRFMDKLQLPSKAKVSAVHWLPFKDMNANGRVMNTLLLAADVKGQLHILDKTGRIVSSVASGHIGAVTAMIVSKQHEYECMVVTGGAHGDIRIHSISRPPRHTLKPPLDPKNSGGKKTVWQPLVRLVTHFSPSTVEMLAGLGPAHFRADCQGAKAIESVEFVPRGRNSYHLLVSDAAGRVSVHMKNGTLIASHQLEAKHKIEGHAATKVWTALSIDKKLVIYEPRHRRLEPVACSRFMRADEVRAKQAAEDAEAAPGMEEEGEGTQRKRRKGPPGPRPRIPLNFTVETLSADAFSETTSPLFVGTSDGRMLLLKIALEKGKPSCTLMHDVSVMQGPDADRAPVAVMAVRDRVVAAVSSKSGTSLNVYNYSASPRKPPGLVHYVPLDVGGQQLLQLAGDTGHGVAMIVALKTAWLFHLEVSPILESSDWWNLELVLENFRTPAMVIGMVLVLWWQLRRRNANSKGGLGTLLNMAADRARGGKKGGQRYEHKAGMGAMGRGSDGRPW